MKAKDLAQWLLKEPDLDVVIFDGNKLVDINTFTIGDKGNGNLFDKNDGNGIITIFGDCIENSQFNKDVFILYNQKNYNGDQ